MGFFADKLAHALAPDASPMPFTAPRDDMPSAAPDTSPGPARVSPPAGEPAHGAERMVGGVDMHDTSVHVVTDGCGKIGRCCRSADLTDMPLMPADIGRELINDLICNSFLNVNPSPLSG